MKNSLLHFLFLFIALLVAQVVCSGMAITAARHRPTPQVLHWARTAWPVVAAGTATQGIAACRTASGTRPTNAASTSAFALPYSSPYKSEQGRDFARKSSCEAELKKVQNLFLASHSICCGVNAIAVFFIASVDKSYSLCRLR